MTNNTTYEDLLNAFNSFEAYPSFVTQKFDDDLWLKTQAENTIQAYECYRSTLPNGIHKQKAIANINEIKRQQAARAEQQRQEAQRQRELEEQRKKEQAIADDKAAYEHAKHTDTKDAYEKYLKNFTTGTYRTEAEAKVDHFLKLEERSKKEQAIADDKTAYEHAKHTDTKAAYEKYLKNFTTGAYRIEAEAKVDHFLKLEQVETQRQRELKEKQEEKNRKERLLNDEKERLPLLIGGAFVSLILITLFYLYPAKTLATIVIVSSVIAGFLSFAAGASGICALCYQI